RHVKRELPRQHGERDVDGDLVQARREMQRRAAIVQALDRRYTLSLRRADADLDDRLRDVGKNLEGRDDLEALAEADAARGRAVAVGHHDPTQPGLPRSV